MPWELLTLPTWAWGRRCWPPEIQVVWCLAAAWESLRTDHRWARGRERLTGTGQVSHRLNQTSKNNNNNNQKVAAQSEGLTLQIMPGGTCSLTLKELQIEDCQKLVRSTYEKKLPLNNCQAQSAPYWSFKDLLLDPLTFLPPCILILEEKLKLTS